MSNTQTTRLRDMLDIAQDEMIMRDRIAGILDKARRQFPKLPRPWAAPPGK